LRFLVRLQIGVIQSTEQLPLLQLITDIHRKLRDLAINFRPHRNLISRTNLTCGVDGEAYVTRLNRGG
jgi:hypothetical protein